MKPVKFSNLLKVTKPLSLLSQNSGNYHRKFAQNTGEKYQEIIVMFQSDSDCVIVRGQQSMETSQKHIK